MDMDLEIEKRILHSQNLECSFRIHALEQRLEKIKSLTDEKSKHDKEILESQLEKYKKLSVDLETKIDEIDEELRKN